jgi:hypothetical protein
VLDIPFFSSIIYIWYEGGRLRPPVVNHGGRHQARVRTPSGGTMAKKAKKAAKKAKKAKKK